MQQYKFNLYCSQDPQKIGADPEVSVFLAASAGTGKTKVLCERFLNLVLSGVEPSKILCVTFTNSAAAEMLDRIMELSRSWCELSDEDIKFKFPHLKDNQLHEVRKVYNKILFNKYNLKIRTLHAFCHDILTHYNNLNENTNNQLIDTSIKSQKIKQIFSILTKSFLSLNNEIKESFIKLSQTFALSEIENRIYYLLNQITDFTKYIDKYEINLKTHLFDLHDVSVEFNYLNSQKLLFKNLDNDTITTIEKVSIIDKRALNVLESIHNCDYTVLYECLITLENKPRSIFNSQKVLKTIPEITEIIKNLQDQLLNIEQMHKNKMFANFNYAFIKIANHIVNEYKVFKNENGYFDFDDLINGTLKLMDNDPGILYALDYQIDHILVDEAQDLSEKQWELIKLLSSEFYAGYGVQEKNRTLFVVGDFKQSIFSFQGAKPELFAKANCFYANKASPLGVWREVEMNRSFRSELNIIKLVNLIFPNLFSNFSNHLSNKNNLGHVEIWPLVDHSKKDSQIGWELPEKTFLHETSSAILAELIADKIFDWVLNCRQLSNDQCVEPGDIMILVRKRSELIDILSFKLRGKNIKVITPKHTNFMEELIIMDLVSVINFLICPEDDLNTAALLKSPFFGLSDNELVDLSLERGEKSLIDILAKIRIDVYDSLNGMKDLFQRQSVNLAFIELVNTFFINFVDRFGAGAKVYLDDFLEAVTKFNIVNNHGCLKELLDYLTFYEPGSAANKNDPASSVRIMTVHAAKGLQSPIVILADAASSELKPIDDVFFHDDEIYFAAGAGSKSKCFENIQRQREAASSNESKRLLYVAITRAESELYIAGIKGNKFDNSWYSIVAPHINEDMKSEYKYCSTPLNDSDDVNSSPSNIVNIKPARKINYAIKSLAVLEGDIIHDFLEKLCELDEFKANKYLEIQKIKYKANFNEPKMDEFFSEALNVKAKFPEFFMGNILNEQSFSIMVDIQKILRIDRLIIDNKNIYIIDFKTDDNPPQTYSEVRSEYINQIKSYIKVVSQVYPDYIIKGLLLWTKTLHTVEIIDR